MSGASFRVYGLCAGYGQARVLDDLSFDRGTEVVAFVGRNGMGKTTLRDSIMGLVPPWSGTITHEGERLDDQTPERIARSGIA